MFVTMLSTCYYGVCMRLCCVLAVLATLPSVPVIAYPLVDNRADSIADHQQTIFREHPDPSDPTQSLRQVRHPRYEIELLNDNDMYLMLLQDQYYTNGLFLNLRKSTDPSKLKPTEQNRLLEFTLGHQIYNAYTAQIDSIEAVDRPIAAYFFLSAGMKHFYRGDHFLAYSLELGTLGKRAFGEVLQVQLHRLLNMYEASGWEFQLRNAWGANAHLHYNGLIVRWGNQVKLDLSLNSQLSIGTQRTRAAAAPLIRLGRLNPFSQSAHFSARLQSRGLTPDREFYFFYRPETNYVYYDATLQGGMFVRDKGPAVSEPNRWLLSNQFGAVYAAGAITFKVQYIFNTKEAEQSMFRHQYGSLSLAYQF